VNGTPTPPLPSVTYRTLDELSGNQTFKTAGVSLPATTGNGGAAKTYKFGSGIALAYDAAADSYIRNRAMNDAPGGCPSASFDGHAGRAR